MALYFDREVQRTPGLPVQGTSCTDLIWHPKHSILAVASKDDQKDADGAVRFYNGEVRAYVLLYCPCPARRLMRTACVCALQGGLLYEAVLQRSVAVECLAWHPSLRLLASGWRSGEVAFYNDHTRSYSEQSSTHKAPVTCLLWGSAGQRLVSCDKVQCTMHVCVCMCCVCAPPPSTPHPHTAASSTGSLPCGPWTRREGSTVSLPTTSGCRLLSLTVFCTLQRGAVVWGVQCTG